MSTNKQTLFERLMAVNPADADLSVLGDFDGGRDLRIGTIGEFELRLLVVRQELMASLERVDAELELAFKEHDRFHEDNPSAEHGGELCKAVVRSSETLKTTKKEIRLLTDILLMVTQIDYPDAKAVGLRNDGSVTAITEDHFFASLARELSKDVTRRRASAGGGVIFVDIDQNTR